MKPLRATTPPLLALSVLSALDPSLTIADACRAANTLGLSFHIQLAPMKRKRKAAKRLAQEARRKR